MSSPSTKTAINKEPNNELYDSAVSIESVEDGRNLEPEISTKIPPDVIPANSFEEQLTISDRESATSFVEVFKKKHILRKIIFSVSVLSLIVWACGIISVQWIIPYFFTSFFPVLIPIRIYFYRREKYLLFLLDFCYFINALCFIYIWAIPTQKFVFAVLFSCANGPLMWATLTFRNSLVFHSLDKMTSVFIHLLPVFLTYCIRWYPGLTSRYWYTSFLSDFEAPSLIWLVAVPFGGYVLHCSLYFLIIHFIIKPHEENLDTFRYLGKKGAFSKLINLFGAKFRYAMYFFWNWLYTLATIFWARLLYEYFIAHVVFLCLMFLCVIYNGASYYMDIFRVKGFTAESH